MDFCEILVFYLLIIEKLCIYVVIDVAYFGFCVLIIK
jgi:hypothetical protein